MKKFSPKIVPFRDDGKRVFPVTWMSDEERLESQMRDQLEIWENGERYLFEETVVVDW